MPVINGNVREKWSKVPLANLIVTVNGDFFARTDKLGRFAGTLPEGTYRLCVTEEMPEENYEVNCQTVIMVSDMTLNIQLKPIFRAL